ncbi:hypothetical protein HZI73_18235 [Vallitalea pronyensis]|uniref:Lipoprotein n=1 Tax=Vallitalea pronyensis TaxID=1348613 RepID=A0A8J8MMR8_9FIRM|nr:hypothetical protein [Vallitalea pronyensis]QUI24113.1 hypothetical protein HZI73_18235 [Vallitalea pronyensis]
MKLQKAIICLLVFMIVLTGCRKETLEFEAFANHMGLVEESEYGKIMMEFSKLDGEDIRSFSTQEGKKYEFQYNYLITEGAIEVQFRDSQGNVITSINLSEDEYKEEKESLQEESNGPVEIHEFCRVISVKSRDKRIKIALIGKEAKGNFNITW